MEEPGPEVKKPARHGKHGPCSEQVPEVHIVHSMLLCCDPKPAEQFVQVDDPEAEAQVPAGQFVQEDDPESEQYVPAEHDVQLELPVELV